MARLHSFVDRLVKLGGYLAAAILIAMVGHIILEIVLRTFFAASTFVLDEFVGYGVAAMTFLAAGHTLRSGVFIRVNILINRLAPRGAIRRFVEIFCALSTLFATGLVAYFFWISASRQYTRGTVSETIAEVPLWIPEGLVLLGLGLLCLQLISYAFELLCGGAPMESESPASDPGT